MSSKNKLARNRCVASILSTTVTTAPRHTDARRGTDGWSGPHEHGPARPALHSASSTDSTATADAISIPAYGFRRIGRIGCLCLPAVPVAVGKNLSRGAEHAAAAANF